MLTDIAKICKYGIWISSDAINIIIVDAENENDNANTNTNTSKHKHRIRFLDLTFLANHILFSLKIYPKG